MDECRHALREPFNGEQPIVNALFRLWAKIFAAIYGGEGINIPLMFMPTRTIAPVLRRYGAKIGERVRFKSPLVIHNSALAGDRYYKQLVVGSDCYFGRELFLDLQDKIIIEDRVTISHRVMILTHTDAGSSPLKDESIQTSQSPVIIRRGAYIGANVTILEGVEIGELSIVGAGAVVTKSVSPGTVVGGVPARVIKSPEQVEVRRLRATK